MSLTPQEVLVNKNMSIKLAALLLAAFTIFGVFALPASATERGDHHRNDRGHHDHNRKEKHRKPKHGERGHKHDRDCDEAPTTTAPPTTEAPTTTVVPPETIVPVPTTIDMPPAEVSDNPPSISRDEPVLMPTPTPASPELPAELAFTGVETWHVMIIGLVLLILGIWLTIRAKRCYSTQDAAGG